MSIPLAFDLSFFLKKKDTHSPHKLEIILFYFLKSSFFFL